MSQSRWLPILFIAPFYQEPIDLSWKFCNEMMCNFDLVQTCSYTIEMQTHWLIKLTSTGKVGKQCSKPNIKGRVTIRYIAAHEHSTAVLLNNIEQ